jgi:hypothetical protein
MRKLLLSLFVMAALPIAAATPGWWNVQWPPSGTVQQGGSFIVYAQVWMDGVTSLPGQAEGMKAWIGVSTENTDPSTWTTWVEATYNTDSGNNDEFQADIAVGLSAGTYYYASRFQYEESDFFYGGLGGPWNGIGNNSGVLTVTALPQIEWANLQWPGSGTIEPGMEYNVYAQVYKSGVTEAEGQGAGIQVWIGYSTENTDPSGWTNWIAAVYNADVGSNDEYVANLAHGLAEGTYYYASRFQLGESDYIYGGFSEASGGFWDGVTHVSGVLTIEEDTTTTGLESAKNDLTVYRNAANQLVVEHSGTAGSIIRVYSINGQQLHSQATTGSVTVLDVLLPAGNYIVKLGDASINVLVF